MGLTRSAGESVTLLTRDARAEEANADVLLAIHHDSAQVKYLERTGTVTKPAYRARPSLREHYAVGFSFFVSKKKARYEESLRLARCIGRKLRAVGRTPSTYHAEPIENEGRAFIDPELGVYDDDLVVLKHERMPAVLLEVG